MMVILHTLLKSGTRHLWELEWNSIWKLTCGLEATNSSSVRSFVFHFHIHITYYMLHIIRRGIFFSWCPWISRFLFLSGSVVGVVLLLKSVDEPE